MQQKKINCNGLKAKKEKHAREDEKMYYKRLQKYGKKLAAAILTSALLLASGATVYAEDTGEYLAQENIQETESVTDTSELAEAEADKSEDSKMDQETKKEEAVEVETQKDTKTQDVSEEQSESEAQIKAEKQSASESAAVPELNEEAQQPAVQSQGAQIAVQTQTVEAPHLGWNQSGGQTYYLDENMNRLTGWRLLGNVWYYFDDQGVMAIGWRWIGGKWYYMNSAGAMQSGWFQDGQTWYYANGSGVMQTGWLNRGGTWYYLTGSGAMAEGWGNIGGTWYYFQPGNGAMQVGWVKDGNIWYYMNGSGAMETDTWIGNSYVDANGVWDQSKTKAQAYWVQNNGRWLYVQEDGSYAKSTWKTIDGKEYYFGADGYMVTGWLKQGSTWYYLKPTAKNSAEKVGEKAYNYWVGTAGIGGYYIDKYGRMIAGKDYSLGSYVYTFDANGLCTNRENRYLQVTDANGRKYNVEKKTYLSDPQVGVDVTEDEFLAAAVYAESANQGLTGMTGVAMVMLNRMRTNKTSLAPYPSEAKNMIYQATQFEVARDGALTKSLNLIVSGKGGTAMENAKKAVANARAICDAYDNNKTDDLSDEVQGILKELKIPEGYTMLEYLGFMTPKAFENANLDPEKTHAFTYKNTTFYSTWIKKS